MSFFSSDFFARIIGAIVFAILGAFVGSEIATYLDVTELTYTVLLGLLGALMGLTITPYISTHPLRHIRRQLLGMPPQSLVAITLGTFLGLLASTLITRPLSLLPNVFSQLAPILVAIVFVYLGITVMVARQNDMWTFFSNLRPLLGGEPVLADSEKKQAGVVLLDTSVIIDGRITDISKTKFLRDTLLVPSFVLHELQFVADSSDPLRRNRGKRGLEVLSMLQKESPVPVQITDMDVSEVREVDSKLVALARHLRCPIMTNDYNLNRVAELQGVTVLNINDLANAVKPSFLPGEELNIKIIQEGREAGQGVGYLEDGTMVVVEDGDKMINKQVPAIVTKTLQTSAGRMVFARIDQQ